MTQSQARENSNTRETLIFISLQDASGTKEKQITLVVVLCRFGCCLFLAINSWNRDIYTDWTLSESEFLFPNLFSDQRSPSWKSAQFWVLGQLTGTNSSQAWAVPHEPLLTYGFTSTTTQPTQDTPPPRPLGHMDTTICIRAYSLNLYFQMAGVWVPVPVTRGMSSATTAALQKVSHFSCVRVFLSSSWSVVIAAARYPTRFVALCSKHQKIATR